MNSIIMRAIACGFIDLGFAPWVSGQGLQIQNLEKLEKGLPGVYIMHDDGAIQKIGKSSADLYARLKNYRGFDVDSLAHPLFGRDKTSQVQRQAMQGQKLKGLNVLALQAKPNLLEFTALKISVRQFSFDPHDLEKKLARMARSDLASNPMRFGPK